MSTLKPACSAHRQLWQLRRQGQADQAWALLDRQVPFALTSDGIQEDQRLLLDAFLQEGLSRLGLQALQSRLEEQHQRFGLPDDRAALEELLTSCRLSGDQPTAFVALLELIVLDGPAPQPSRQLALAEVLALLGELEEALHCCLYALGLGRLNQTDAARGHDLAALLHYRLGDRQGCYRHLFDAVAHGSQDPLTLQFLCRLQTQRGDLDAAAASLERITEQGIAAFALREQRLRLGLALATGLAEAELLEQLCAGLGGGLFEDGAELLALAPTLLATNAQVLQLRDALLRNRLRQSLGNPQPAPLTATPSGPIRRLGVLAPAYSPGSAGALVQQLEPWLAAEGLELQWFCSLEHAQPDPSTTGSTITSVAGMATAEAVSLLRGHELEGLIDLTGWNDGQRHDLLRERVAPLQLGWLSSEFSSGLSELDYLLVDRFQAPPLTEGFTEGLLVLPGSFLALTGPIPATPLPVISGGHLVVLAPAAHVQQQCLALWATLLSELPEQRIWFGHPSFQQTLVWERLLASFSQLGIGAERLERGSAMQASPGGASLLLDPYPWGDWSSVLRALQQGLPVVTLRGTALHQRRSSGLLDLIGLGSFAAAEAESYLAIAHTLLADADLQSALHQAIPQQLQASLLMNPKQFAADLSSSLAHLKRRGYGG